MVVRQGLGASIAYGARVRGTPRPIVRFIQQKDSAIRRGAAAFTSRVLHDGLDPSCADTIVLAPVLAWAREAWDHPEGRRAQATAWARVQHQLEVHAEADPQDLWQVVRGPAGATTVTVRAHGWRMPSAFEIFHPPRGGVLQGADVHLDMLQVCPKSVEVALLYAARGRALAQWAAAKPERAALLPAPRLSPARQLIKRGKQDGWLQHHADAAKKAVLGGYPSQEALFTSGQADAPNCQLCDDSTEFGTMQHYYWQCSSPTCASVRDQLTACDAAPAFRDVCHLGATASSSEAARWLWERGLRRTPCYGLAWDLPEQRVYWIVEGADSELNGVLVSDGSVKGLGDLRHGGWAALQCTADAHDVEQGLYGSLPFPDPSSVLAELWGLFHSLRHAVFITTIIIDNAQGVQGLARGRVSCCSAARPYAHVWAVIWDRLDDMGITPGQDLSVVKVASHISHVKRQALPDELKQELKATKHVLEYIGHFRVLLGDAKLAVPRPRQQQQGANAPSTARPKAAPKQPHVLEACRGYHKCANCGKVARARLAAFQLQECRGRLQGLQGKTVKSAIKRGSVAVPLLVAAGATGRAVRQRSDHEAQDEELRVPDQTPSEGPPAQDSLWAPVAAARAALRRVEAQPDGPVCMGVPPPALIPEQHRVMSIIDDAVVWASFWIDRFDLGDYTKGRDYRTWCSEYLEVFLGAEAWAPVREHLLRSSPGRTLRQIVDDLCAASWTRAEPARQAQFARMRSDSDLTRRQRRRLLRHHFDVLHQIRVRFRSLLGDRAPPETASWHQWVFEPLSSGSDDQGGDVAIEAQEYAHGYDNGDECAVLSVHSDVEFVAAGARECVGADRGDEDELACSLGLGGGAAMAGASSSSAAAAAPSAPERGARGRPASAQLACRGQLAPVAPRAASAEPRPRAVEIVGTFVVCVVCGSYYSSVARAICGPCRRLDPKDPGDRERQRRIHRIKRGQDPKTGKDL
ncbi:unnamed protein product, partial [Prorocentrum cordatum]